MTNDNLIKEINRRILLEIGMLSESLCSGGAGCYDEYKRICGKISGLRSSLTHVAESELEYMSIDDNWDEK